MPCDKEFEQFLQHHLEIIEPLNREAALAWWDAALTGAEEHLNRSAELSARLWKIYSEPKDYQRILRMSDDPPSDPLLARQLKLLLNAYQGGQFPPDVIDRIVNIEKEIEAEYDNFRAPLRGKPVTDNHIADILRSSNDVALRKDAWEASKLIAPRVVDRIQELIRLRNREAQRLGYADFYSMSLHLSELDEEGLFAILEDLHRQTEPLWRRYKSDLDDQLAARFGTTSDHIYPWHYSDPFFQEAPPDDLALYQLFSSANLVELASQFYTEIGLPVDDILARSDLYEKSGKSQHAFCTDIDRNGDVRILCNLRPDARWMTTILHELGHAVYDKYNDPQLPYLLREPAHTLFTEAIAELMGRLSMNRDWLERYLGLDEQQAISIGRTTDRALGSHLLVFTRWCLVMIHFEREMYRQPDQDLNRLWWDLVEKYQDIRKPEGRSEPDWAAKIHLAQVPVYYQNYLLGEMVASQLHHYIVSQVIADEGEKALVNSPKVGRTLQERVFKLGATHPWDETLKLATGEPLKAEYFVTQMGVEVG